jgi:hypothetical protein
MKLEFIDQTWTNLAFAKQCCQNPIATASAGQRRFARNVQAASRLLHIWPNLDRPPFYFVTNSTKQRHPQVPAAGTGKLLNQLAKGA